MEDNIILVNGIGRGAFDAMYSSGKVKPEKGTIRSAYFRRPKGFRNGQLKVSIDFDIGGVDVTIYPDNIKDIYDFTGAHDERTLRSKNVMVYFSDGGQKARAIGPYRKGTK